MRRALPLAAALLVVGVTWVRADDTARVPPTNAPSLTVPPPRPPAGDAEAKARRLFDAIVADDPDRILDFFLPREAFRQIKAMANPDRRYDRLLAAYEADIHALHGARGGLEGATYEGFDLARRGGWVPVGEEANRLPYWASRHSRIRYRVGERTRSFEVRVLITWDDHWYVTHLSEFH